MKPFNLERALAGDPVVIHAGAKVTRIIKYVTSETGAFTLIGLCEGKIYFWDEKGKYSTHTGTEQCDLMMAKKPRQDG